MLCSVFGVLPLLQRCAFSRPSKVKFWVSNLAVEISILGLTLTITNKSITYTTLLSLHRSQLSCIDFLLSTPFTSKFTIPSAKIEAIPKATPHSIWSSLLILSFGCLPQLLKYAFNALLRDSAATPGPRRILKRPTANHAAQPLTSSHDSIRCTWIIEQSIFILSSRELRCAVFRGVVQLRFDCIDLSCPVGPALPGLAPSLDSK